jgi:hypothetical protein
MMEMMSSSMIYLIYCKNFIKASVYLHPAQQQQQKAGEQFQKLEDSSNGNTKEFPRVSPPVSLEELS